TGICVDCGSGLLLPKMSDGRSITTFRRACALCLGHDRTIAQHLADNVPERASALPVDDADERHPHQVGIVQVSLDDRTDLLDPLSAQIQLDRHWRHGGLHITRQSGGGSALWRLGLAESLQPGQGLTDLERSHLDLGLVPVQRQHLALLAEREDADPVPLADLRALERSLPHRWLLLSLDGADGLYGRLQFLVDTSSLRERRSSGRAALALDLAH